MGAAVVGMELVSGWGVLPAPRCGLNERQLLKLSLMGHGMLGKTGGGAACDSALVKGALWWRGDRVGSGHKNNRGTRGRGAQAVGGGRVWKQMQGVWSAGGCQRMRLGYVESGLGAVRCNDDRRAARSRGHRLK